MILFKRLAGSVLHRNSFLGIRTVVSCENIPLNGICELNKLKIVRETPPHFQFLVRMLSTGSKENVKNVKKSEECLWSEEIEKGSEECAWVEEDEELEDSESTDKETRKSTIELFEEISAGDPEKLRKLKLLEFEVAILREEECRVPDQMTKYNWTELLDLDSLNKRKKFLAFLRLNELKKMARLQKVESKLAYYEKLKEELGFHFYGLSGHTMFMRVYDKDVNKLLYLRQLYSKLNIILDCSYQEYMSYLNTRACARQIFYTITESRLHRYPSQVQICNLDKNDTLGKVLPNYVQGIYENPIYNISSGSYLDLYPKEKLVYLTPHTNYALKKFNPDDVYIIGAFVDKGTGVKASLAKAKEYNLRMMRLPIDEYLFWKQGTKSLPLNIVLTVLLDMAFYNDWSRAFKSIPTRCLTNY